TPTSVGTQFCEVVGSGDDCTTTLELSAVGLRSLAPFCDVNVTSVDFGDVNFRDSPSFDVVVTNLGSENLSGTVSLEDCNSLDFWISTETTYFLLTNEQAVFTVNFLPTAEGPANCTLNLDNVTCDPIPITGNGVDPMTPECVLSVEELDFGGVTIGQTLDLPITVTNGFSGSLTGTPTLDDPDGVFSIVQNPGSFALGADESVEIVVRFSPGADNTSNATLSLGSDCDPVPIVGTGGLAPACSLDTASLAFGAITVGDQENFDIQITNSGGGTLSGTVTTDCPDLTIQGSASYSLDGNESATISFRLIPTSPGSIDCSIDFGVGCADVPVTATVSGVSFVTDLQPQLQAGCGCHGWSYNSARARVNTANPTDSNMLKACTTFHSSRGGPCVSGWASGESNYNLALQWVQQGAFDN
ncbi:MAG: choice-of-anchor D domain-containing protein, partial [Gemmatimonadetes bacterium]|nr:choice-of-anchor D domain-containing protein [Gemmatimonadota bacterium]